MPPVLTSQGGNRARTVSHDSNLAHKAGASSLTTRAYHELRKNPHFEIDGLQRLHENLVRLEELHGRLHFMMKEISTLTRR